MIIDINNKSLKTENDDFWIAPDATVIGDVQMATDTSIWFHCTVRGDNEPIILGEGTNIQDNSVIHTDPGFHAILVNLSQLVIWLCFTDVK